MRKVTIKTEKVIEYKLTWLEDYLLIATGGDSYGGYSHEHGLPSASEKFPQELIDAAKDEIRKHRAMDDNEFYGPDGYVTFRMEDGCAAAVMDDDLSFSSLMKPGEAVKMQGLPERYYPQREHLRAWYLKYHAPQWTVSEWDEKRIWPGVVVKRPVTGGMIERFFNHESQLASLPDNCPSDIVELARRRIREKRPEEENEARDNYGIYTLSVKDGSLHLSSDLGKNHIRTRSQLEKRVSASGSSCHFWTRCLEYFDRHCQCAPNQVRNELGQIFTLAWRGGMRMCRAGNDSAWCKWSTGLRRDWCRDGDAWFDANRPLAENEVFINGEVRTLYISGGNVGFTGYSYYWDPEARVERWLLSLDWKSKAEQSEAFRRCKSFWEANRPLADNEITINGESYEITLSCGYAVADIGYISPCYSDSLSVSRSEWCDDGHVKWLGDFERLEAYDRLKAFWEANCPLADDEKLVDGQRVKMAANEMRFDDGTVGVMSKTVERYITFATQDGTRFLKVSSSSSRCDGDWMWSGEVKITSEPQRQRVLDFAKGNRPLAVPNVEEYPFITPDSNSRFKVRPSKRAGCYEFRFSSWPCGDWMSGNLSLLDDPNDPHNAHRDEIKRICGVTQGKLPIFLITTPNASVKPSDWGFTGRVKVTLEDLK
jgi:hypothetical protein